MSITTFRAWKKHLRSTSKENQLAIYQTLCLLESEVDVTQFLRLMSDFISHWEPKEPQFIDYFKDHYQKRVGKLSYNMCHNLTIIIIITGLGSAPKCKNVDGYISMNVCIYLQKNGQGVIATSNMLILTLTCF